MLRLLKQFGEEEEKIVGRHIAHLVMDEITDLNNQMHT